uniref:Saposin B-type domain-containing protein n=1 Tax=Pygocentrus nattereri TaxID=42514 RepID=A0AAR2K855_PYGNA
MICCINTLSWIAAVQCGELTASDYDPMTDALDNNLQVREPVVQQCKYVGHTISKVYQNRSTLTVSQLNSILIICRSFIQKYKMKLVNAISAGKRGVAVCKSLKLC